jgi:hypothetical protein
MDLSLKSIPRRRVVWRDFLVGEQEASGDFFLRRTMPNRRGGEVGVLAG